VQMLSLRPLGDPFEPCRWGMLCVSGRFKMSISSSARRFVLSKEQRVGMPRFATAATFRRGRLVPFGCQRMFSAPGHHYVLSSERDRAPAM
jgi:hypothetical protein